MADLPGNTLADAVVLLLGAAGFLHLWLLAMSAGTDCGSGMGVVAHVKKSGSAQREQIRKQASIAGSVGG